MSTMHFCLLTSFRFFYISICTCVCCVIHNVNNFMTFCEPKTLLYIPICTNETNNSAASIITLSLQTLRKFWTSHINIGSAESGAKEKCHVTFTLAFALGLQTMKKSGNQPAEAMQCCLQTQFGSIFCASDMPECGRWVHDTEQYRCAKEIFKSNDKPVQVQVQYLLEIALENMRNTV